MERDRRAWWMRHWLLGGKIGHLHHAVDADPTLIDVLDLEPGYSATRERVGGAWTREWTGR